MPYRANKIRWELLVDPISSGLNMEVGASANLGHAIGAAGGTIGKAIAGVGKRRVEKSQFDQKMALANAELAERKRANLAREQEKQANEVSTVDDLMAMSDAIGENYKQTGQVDQPLAQQFKMTVDAVGGEKVAGPKIQQQLGWAGAMTRPGGIADLINSGVAGAQPAPLVGPNGTPVGNSAEFSGQAELFKAHYAQATKYADMLRQKFSRLRGQIPHAKAEEIAANIRQVESAALGFSVKMGVEQRKAGVAKAAEDKQAALMLASEMQKGKDAEELRQHNEFFAGRGEAPSANLLDAKQRYGAKYAAPAVSREDNQANQATRDLASAKERGDKFEKMYALQKEGIALRREAQEYRESKDIATVLSKAAKEQTDAIHQKLSDHIRMADVAGDSGDFATMQREMENARAERVKLDAIISKAREVAAPPGGGGEARSRAKARYDALPDDQKSPEVARRLLAEEEGR